MSEPSVESPVSVKRRPPEDVFALLGNELRVAILRALAEDVNEPRSFSELREAVGERDSGKFNYHLRQLDGVFVTRADEGGYELTLAGRRLLGALVAGTYTAEATLEAIEVEEACPSCGATPLVATYEDDYATLVCSGCKEWRNEFSFPPGTLDQYEPDELPAAFDRWMHTLFGRITAGFCANCAGRLDATLDTAADPVAAHWSCKRCGEEARTSVTHPVLYHPVAGAFLYDHGIDLRSTPSWHFPGADAVSVKPDGTGVTVTITLGDERLTARVDENVTVMSAERSTP